MIKTQKVKTKSRRERRKLRFAYLLLIPWLAFFLVFKLFPFVFGIGASFTDYSLKGAKFIGLKNYAGIFTDDKFWISLRANIFYLIIIVPCTILFSLWAAKILQNRGNVFNAVTKSVFYMPALVCSVVIATIWRFLFSSTAGIVPWIINSAGLKSPSFFDEPLFSIPLMSLMVIVGSVGQPIILYAAAMGNIPMEYIEAAAVDGATQGQIFRKITLPLLKPTTVYILITSMIAVLQIFAYPYLLTSGGPYHATSSILLQLYQSAFISGKFGYASALGTILFVITSVFVALQLKFVNRGGEDG